MGNSLKVVKTVEESFLEYLKLVGLEKLDPKSTQYIETRRAFYAGYGSSLMTMTNELADMPEQTAVIEMEMLHDQVKNFWEGQIIV